MQHPKPLTLQSLHIPDDMCTTASCVHYHFRAMDCGPPDIFGSGFPDIVIYFPVVHCQGCPLIRSIHWPNRGCCTLRCWRSLLFHSALLFHCLHTLGRPSIRHCGSDWDPSHTPVLQYTIPPAVGTRYQGKTTAHIPVPIHRCYAAVDKGSAWRVPILQISLLTAIAHP